MGSDWKLGWSVQLSALVSSPPPPRSPSFHRLRRADCKLEHLGPYFSDAKNYWSEQPHPPDQSRMLPPHTFGVQNVQLILDVRPCLSLAAGWWKRSGHAGWRHKGASSKPLLESNNPALLPLPTASVGYKKRSKRATLLFPR